MNGYLGKPCRLFVRVDILYRLVPQLTLFELYFLRYGPLTGTKWCKYGMGGIKKNFFEPFFFISG
jgi:hypothetical protein